MEAARECGMLYGVTPEQFVKGELECTVTLPFPD